MPVVLGPDASELLYVQLSLDLPGKPVFLFVNAHDGLALRIQTSPGTDLAGIHARTDHQSAILGVPPDKVTQTNPETRRKRCASPRLPSEASAAKYTSDGRGPLALGKPQTITYSPPQLGALFDRSAPAPSQWGLIALGKKGYLAPEQLPPEIARDSRHSMGVYKVLKRFRLPAGLNGAHAQGFVVTEGGPVPSGSLGHSEMFKLQRQ